jgi:hypothetical protein
MASHGSSNAVLWAGAQAELHVQICCRDEARRLLIEALDIVSPEYYHHLHGGVYSGIGARSDSPVSVLCSAVERKCSCSTPESRVFSA